jgi:hypothetical protein
MTGVSLLVIELVPKRLELVDDLVPGAAAIAGLIIRHSPDSRWFEARIAFFGVFGNGKSRVA